MSSRHLAFCVLALFCSSSASAADPEPVANLWILSGQSNACGRAKLPGPKPDPRATMYDPASGQFVVAQDPLPGMGTSGVGPWVAAAQTVASGGPEIKMVGFASGGKPISYWNPGKPGDSGLFPRIDQAGQGASVFLWYQGESDAKNNAADYLQALKTLVARVRQRAGNPKLVAVIVQLGAHTGRGNDFAAVRKAQRQFVIQDSAALLVPALGRPLKDSVHLNNAGYQELGREIGRALLRTVYLRQTSWPGPVLDRAVLAADGKTVTAHFAETKTLQHASPQDFVAADADGEATCQGLETGKTILRLTFARPVKLPARLTYAPGEAPKATLVDEDGNRAPAVQLEIRRRRAAARYAHQGAKWRWLVLRQR